MIVLLSNGKIKTTQALTGEQAIGMFLTKGDNMSDFSLFFDEIVKPHAIDVDLELLKECLLDASLKYNYQCRQKKANRTKLAHRLELSYKNVLGRRKR
ncbi:MAG: hypothetical protein GY821_12915 [Gammaproteobacteria bacterium]|nr:hypothetical protein [Gammaproteobacteria bacterium]